MAAFCGCCGAEITLKAEACPVCGTPRHGMSGISSPTSLASEIPVNEAHAPHSLFACEARKEMRHSKGVAG